MADFQLHPKWDGHTHSEFCPHASIKRTHLMVEKAIALGFKKYSITEHAPLPKELLAYPETPLNSSILTSELPDYLLHLQDLKKHYAAQIQILIGLEVDYLLEMEDFTQKLLTENERFLDEIIYSLHFLPSSSGRLKLLDKSAEDIQLFFPNYSAEKLWEVYWQSMEKMLSIQWKFSKPIRVGHLLLIEKYRKKNPISRAVYKKWLAYIVERILPLVAQKKYSLDWNVAGLRKKYCQKIYWKAELTDKAKELNIPLVYGSDSHDVSEVGADFNSWESFLKKSEKKK